MAGSGLAEWLALHELTAEQMQALTAAAPPAPDLTPMPPLPPLPPDAETIWSLAAEALTAAFPAGRDIIARTRNETRRNLAADPARFPRAFTLWQPPYVSCPSGGGIKGLLTLAHEFGHANQIFACQAWANQIFACQISACSPGAAQPPPILREMAAFLTELALLDHLARTRPPLHAAARQDFDAATRRIMTGPRQRLAAALRAGSGAYRYDWNYPPARAAALRVWGQGDRFRGWSVFDGRLKLASLLQ